MHNTRRFITTLFIITLAGVACGPSAPEATATATVTLPAVVQVVTQAPTEIPVVETATATNHPEPMVQATSRGPDLVASDPSKVKLASGQLQLVEFFSFT